MSRADWDFQEGKKYALEMIEAVPSYHELEYTLQNLRLYADAKPVRYGDGIRSTVRTVERYLKHATASKE